MFKLFLVSGGCSLLGKLFSACCKQVFTDACPELAYLFSMARDLGNQFIISFALASKKVNFWGFVYENHKLGVFLTFKAILF